MKLQWQCKCICAMQAMYVCMQKVIDILYNKTLNLIQSQHFYSCMYHKIESNNCFYSLQTLIDFKNMCNWNYEFKWKNIIIDIFSLSLPTINISFTNVQTIKIEIYQRKTYWGNYNQIEYIFRIVGYTKIVF